MERVSWYDVQEFIRKLNHQTGLNYRLPTEAEWEYACHSDGDSLRYCGSDEIDEVGWFTFNSGVETHPVGRKKA